MTAVDKEIIPPPTAGLHALCDQAQGGRRELGILLGAVGDAGAHV